MPVQMKMAVKPVAYHHDYSARLRWEKDPERDWWQVAYKSTGQVFAEMWKAPSGLWYGMLYTSGKKPDGTLIESARVFRDPSGRWIELTICGVAINRRT